MRVHLEGSLPTASEEFTYFAIFFFFPAEGQSNVGGVQSSVLAFANLSTYC